MNNIKFIANQLQKYKNNLPKKVYKNIDSVCAFTGEKIKEGILKKDFISSTFTDFEYIKYPSDYVGLDIALCMDYIIPNENNKLISLRFKSFYCSDKEIKFLKREDLEDLVFNIPNFPFILCVSFGFKKHISYKSKINYSTNKFIINTDKGILDIDLYKIKELYGIIKEWYTILKGKENTTQQPTYFTKDDILYGCKNYNKIQGYGDSYFIENSYIEQYRNTFLLQFLVHILNKKGKIKND